jgi:hypothetical protein
MDSLNQALRGASHASAAPLARLETALVIGAGGMLGSAVLAEALVGGRFQHVSALTTGPLKSTVRGLRTLDLAHLQDPPEPDRRPAGQAAVADLAFLVFERERHSNGRDDAFLQPAPTDLVALAGALRDRGVRRLLVVVPHAPALLPHALKAGFASRDEGAVAALGFEHLVFVRAAQVAGATTAGNRMQRFAAWWLSQLSWMVPTSEQPVRAVILAALMVQLARLLAAAPAGTRVLPPEVLQACAQAEDPQAVLRAWLSADRP